MSGQSPRTQYRFAHFANAQALFVLVFCLCLFCFAPQAFGQVTTTGNISPDLTVWNSGRDVKIPYSGHGTLSITNGSSISNRHAYVCYLAGATATINVDGGGSTWNTYGQLSLGYNDNQATLNISNGGYVNVHQGTFVSTDSSINFNNGTLITNTLVSGVDNLSGTGTINTNGLINDVDLVFDGSHGLYQSLTINENPGQNINLNLHADGSGWMGAGYSGSGTMSVSGGIDLESQYGYIGYKSGSTGVVTVGWGGSWTNTSGYEDLFVGHYGNGTLNIINGGDVSNTTGSIANKSGSTGLVKVDGAGSTWTNSHSVYVGRYGQGTLEIKNGGVVSNTKGYVGYGSAGGVATVDGAGSTWTNSGALAVKNGKMDITHGGKVTSDSGTIGGYYGSGEVNVDGAGSKWTNSGDFIVGDSVTTGTLNITNGGVVSASDNYLGYDSDSTGVVTVDGAGSKFFSHSGGYISVGYEGSGTLNISNGGQVISNNSAYIGNKSNSTGIVTVDGTESKWTSNYNLYVGYYGNGTFNIKNGGSAKTANSSIGFQSSSTGIVNVDGTGSIWNNNGYLYVGTGSNANGSGTLKIINGGTVNTSGKGQIGSSYSTGLVTVDGVGSTWATNENLTIGYEDNSNGTLNITNGGVVSCRSGLIGKNSWKATGLVTVDGVGSKWTNSVDLYVGSHGHGTLNITGGGLVSVAGTLTIDSDNDGDGFINMSYGGMLAIFGDCDNSLLDFVSHVEGSDAIRYWDDSIANWGDITGATLGEDYTLEYHTAGDLAGYTVLTVGEVPEPVTMSLLSIGGCALLRRKRKA